ncbi:MAG: hypothetical protein EHM93_13510 [Bacteroidales bacterium]|nr:MAG: hypothetical protein EHM93_13510 [Bacteroidales bacterium]
MRRARIFLAIVAYCVLIKRLLDRSFQDVFYNNPEPNESSIDTYKLNTHTFKFNRLDQFFTHNSSYNLGLHTGFLARYLLI